jgi:hypothetical protein
MANTRASAFLSLLLVFASGILVGGFGYRAYSTSVLANGGAKAPEKKMSPDEYQKRLIDDMTAEVHLDPQQTAKLKEIYQETQASFDEARARYNAKLRAVEGATIHEQQIEKIKAMLHPDQIPLYDALRARREAEREAEHKKQGGHRKGGPEQK